MVRTINCASCGIEFTTTQPKTLSCSGRCNLKQWRAKNAEKNREIKRQWRRRNGMLKRGSPEHRKKISDWMVGRYVGENHPNWKNGVTPKNELARHSVEYKRWRKAVFERDNYTCQGCGVRGGYLEADHVKPFAFFIELRFEISNGRTLCQPCHKLTPTYKRRVLVCQ